MTALLCPPVHADDGAASPAGLEWGGVEWLVLAVALLLLALLWRTSVRLRAALARAEQAAQRQHALVDALDIGLVVYDAEDRLELWNRDFARLYGTLADELREGRTFESLLRAALERGLLPEAAGREEAWVQERLAVHRQGEHTSLRGLPDGSWRRITERRLGDGRVLSYSIDVTELVAREREMRQLAERLDAANARLAELSETDALTGIPNRRLFDRRLAEECARAGRHDLPLALMMVDVDHFKRYNDRHGHQAGDACLRRIAALLVGATGRRAADLVARYGGEEFVVLLPHTGRDEARQLADECVRAIAEAALPHGDSPVSAHVTVSVGLAVTDSVPDAEPHGSADPWQLLQRADAALYLAKSLGRHRCAEARDDACAQA